MGIVAFAAIAIGADSGAASVCGDRVVSDWSDGRIDRIYPLSCYEEAVAGLPEDVRAYSTAADDISRALQSRVRSAAPPMAAFADPTSSSAEPGIPPVSWILVAGVFTVAALGTWIVQARGAERERP